MTPFDLCEFTHLRGVQEVAKELDRIRQMSTDLGWATLLAEIHETPSDRICEMLAELAQKYEQVIETLTNG